MAIVFYRHFLTQKTLKKPQKPDKSGFSGKSGMLSGPIRPDFSLKNPVCPDILAFLVDCSQILECGKICKAFELDQFDPS